MSDDNVFTLYTQSTRAVTRGLDVAGRVDVHDRMVSVIEGEFVGLQSPGYGFDRWELTPEQAEWLGLALIQVAAELRVKCGDR